MNRKLILIAAAGAVILGVMLLLELTGIHERLVLLQRGVNPGVTLEGTPLGGMSRADVEAFVRETALTIDRLPRNAYLDRETGALVTEVLGCRVDVETTVEKVMQAQPHKMVLLELIQLDPELTAVHYSRVDREIGAYRTWIGGGGGRATNIILATAALNNYILFPGDLFSFNAANGPRTAARGYQPAPVIVGNTVVPGLGGGVCQVSSTLYNAVLQAGLEVVERYPHSQPVGYVPPGRDATISDYLDFKFRNNTDHLLLIKTATWDGSIDIRILQD
ncbi:MAG: VanW family protein [Bacillota bacterium]